MANDIINVRIMFTSKEEKEDLERIKKHYNLKNYTEVIRVAVRKHAEELQEEEMKVMAKHG